MIARIYTAYVVEMTKMIRLKFTYAGPALVVLSVLGALFTHPIERDGASDYAFIAYATSIALNLLGLILVLMFCAAMISSELGSGTIRMVLVRPLRRREFFAAKLLTGITYAVGLSASVAVSVWGVAYVFGDLTGVRYGGELVYTDSAMRATYFLAILLNLFPQIAAVAYALMISTLTRSTGAAIGITVGSWLVLDMVKYPLNIAPFVFSTYMESSWQLFLDRCNALDGSWFPDLQYSILTSIASTIAFVLVAVYALARRNLST